MPPLWKRFCHPCLQPPSAKGTIYNVPVEIETDELLKCLQSQNVDFVKRFHVENKVTFALMSVHRNFSKERQSRHFAYIFQVANADDQVRNQVNRAVPPNTLKKNLFSCHVQHQVAIIFSPLRTYPNTKISAGCDPMKMQCKWTLTKRFTVVTKHTGIKADNFWDWKGYLVRISQICPRNFYATNFLHTNFL